MADTSKINLLGLIGVVGAILLIVGVFLSWVDITATLGGASETVSFSGWEVFNDDELDADYSYAPVLALVAGIIGVIACVLPVVKPLGFEKILGLISLIIAVVAVVIMVLFNGQMDGIDFGGFASFTVKSGIGWIISLVGGILVILGSIVPILMKFKENA